MEIGYEKSCFDRVMRDEMQEFQAFPKNSPEQFPIECPKVVTPCNRPRAPDCQSNWLAG